MLYFVCSVLFAQPLFDEEKLHAVQKELAPFRRLFLASTHPDIPKESYSIAAQGEIATGVDPMPGFSSKIGWGVGIFHIDIDTMWATINNGEKHTGYTPVSYAKVVNDLPCQNKRITLMTLPIPILADRWWVVQSNTNPTLQEKSNGRVREMSWKHIDDPKSVLNAELKSKIEGMIQIPLALGAWTLFDLGDGYTLGEYHTWAQAGGNVPSGLTEIFVGKSVAKTMLAMEELSKNPNVHCSF